MLSTKHTIVNVIRDNVRNLPVVITVGRLALSIIINKDFLLETEHLYQSDEYIAFPIVEL